MLMASCLNKQFAQEVQGPHARASHMPRPNCRLINSGGNNAARQ
jgi:hypothetical protein